MPGFMPGILYSANTDPLCANCAHVEGGDGAMEPLELKLAHRGGVGQRFHGGVNLAVDQDLAALGFTAEARGKVHHAADGSVVKTALGADAAERGIAMRDTDAEAEVMAQLFPFGGKLDDALAHLHRHFDAALAGVGA